MLEGFGQTVTLECVPVVYSPAYMSQVVDLKQWNGKRVIATQDRMLHVETELKEL